MKRNMLSGKCESSRKNNYGNWDGGQDNDAKEEAKIGAGGGHARSREFVQVFCRRSWLKGMRNGLPA